MATIIGRFTFFLTCMCLLDRNVMAAISRAAFSGQAISLAVAAANPRGDQYADQCTGADIGAQIMDCQSRLPTGTNGYKAGMIVLPNTLTEPNERKWSTPVTLGPGVNLSGQGLFASKFVCTVAGSLSDA
jgi:hypothetical protein